VEKKNPQASCEQTEIVAFSESDAVPANHKKKKEGPVHGGLQIRPGCARLKKRTKPAVTLNQVGIFPNQGGRDASALQTKRRGEIKKPIGIGTTHHRSGSARRDPGAKKQKTKQQRPK